ncbi:MAG: glycosyltransferase family 4 protein [Limisphaerales bacterium]
MENLEVHSRFDPVATAAPMIEEQKVAGKIRVAIVFMRFGPYHQARLNAAGRRMELFGVEACGMENTYAWEKAEGADSFTRITLTDRHAGNRQWKREVYREMRRTLNNTKPDAVVIPGWASTEALSALAWCAETRTPVVMMSESTEWDERRIGWKEWIKRRLVGMCSTALAGGTPHASYLEQLGIERKKIFLGYDAVDNDYFAIKAAEARNRKSEIRNQLGLPENFFLASARFVEKKNLPRLIQAYARYRDLVKKSETENKKSEIWDLVLLGDGPLRETLNFQLSTLNLRPHVLLSGFKQYDELPAYYGLASAFVHASTTEQWGLVVNEAMASGLPVLVSNRCGCSADLVREGRNGFTFDPCNVERLAELMVKISDARFSLSSFGMEGQLIIKNWGTERFALGLKQAVDYAVATGPKSASFFDRLILAFVGWRQLPYE